MDEKEDEREAKVMREPLASFFPFFEDLVTQDIEAPNVCEHIRPIMNIGVGV